MHTGKQGSLIFKVYKAKHNWFKINIVARFINILVWFIIIIMRVILALVLVLLAFAIEEPDDQVEEVSHFLL